MVNIEVMSAPKVSTRAQLLMILREQAGKPVSGSKLAGELGVSRVAVWKGIQALANAGYAVINQGAGYALNPGKATDFLYPWEFGEREAMFRHFDQTGSTMDRAREYALRGGAAGTVIVAERQSAGRGRGANNWSSRQGGVFCTILDRPDMALADYFLSSMLYQVAIARVLSSLCGKPARLRWPNDIYIDKRKIAGIMTELEGEGDRINWLAIGMGINVNNTVPSARAVNCAEIARHTVSRHEVLLNVIEEAQRVKGRIKSGMLYAQGNRLLAAEWNALGEGIGARVMVVASGKENAGKAAAENKGRALARGTFTGIDPAGRCIIKTDKGSLYFNPGPVSIVF